MVEVSGQGIEFVDQAGIARFFKVHQVGTTRLLLVVVDIHFHTAALFRQSRPAERALEFEAVVTRGVMRGGDHHTSHRTLMLDCVGYRWSWRIRLGKQNSESV